MKGEVAVEPKDFLYLNDYNIREELWQIWWSHQWLFDPAIEHLSLVKGDSAVKCKIFSLHWWLRNPSHGGWIILLAFCEFVLADKHIHISILQWQHQVLEHYHPVGKQLIKDWWSLVPKWWRQKTFYLCGSITHRTSNPFMEIAETFCLCYDTTQRTCNSLKNATISHWWHY